MSVNHFGVWEDGPLEVLGKTIPELRAILNYYEQHNGESVINFTQKALAPVVEENERLKKEVSGLKTLKEHYDLRGDLIQILHLKFELQRQHIEALDKKIKELEKKAG